MIRAMKHEPSADVATRQIEAGFGAEVCAKVESLERKVVEFESVLKKYNAIAQGYECELRTYRELSTMRELRLLHELHALRRRR